MKLGLDIDGVIANFPLAVIERAAAMGMGEHFPDCCHNVDHWDMSSAMGMVMKDAWLSIDFWLKIKPLTGARPVPVAPDCYITSRPIDSWVTEQWLAIHRFPKATVITVKHYSDKLAAVRNRGLDLFIDDYYETVDLLRSNGVNALLYEAPYQKGHDVAHLPTISHLSEIQMYAKELPANG